MNEQEKRRQFNRWAVKARNDLGRTWVHGLNQTQRDVSHRDAANLYRENWDGCKALWVQRYRLKKAARLSQSEKL